MIIRLIPMVYIGHCNFVTYSYLLFTTSVIKCKISLRKIKVMFSSFCLQLINHEITAVNSGSQKFKFRKITSSKIKNATIKIAKLLEFLDFQ